MKKPYYESQLLQLNGLSNSEYFRTATSFNLKQNLSLDQKESAHCHQYLTRAICSGSGHSVGSANRAKLYSRTLLYFWLSHSLALHDRPKQLFSVLGQSRKLKLNTRQLLGHSGAAPMQSLARCMFSSSPPSLHSFPATAHSGVSGTRLLRL